MQSQTTSLASTECTFQDQLLNRIRTRTAHIAIIGLGYVGLPLATQFAKVGFHVTGLDIDEAKVAKLNEGVSYIQDVESTDVHLLVHEQRLQASTDFAVLAQADVVIICVPTPLDKLKKPDISYILSAAESIQEQQHPGQLIVLESTTYPGTTDEVLLPIFERTGLKLDTDFFLAFSPERIDPGNPTYQVHNIPKLVGGITQKSTMLTTELYSSFLSVHQVSSARAAEAAKLLENTFRSVNIALVNELAQLCHVLDIDVWEVVEAAGTKPFGFMKFYPGPGIGGHCIPLDPHYLSWKARAHGYEPRFIELAEEINTNMPDYVISRVAEALNSQRKCINGSNILIAGVAYKPDIDDCRESPALKLMSKLQRLGCNIQYTDPHIPELSLLTNEGMLALRSQMLDAQMLAQSDCVLVVTNHQAFDYGLIAKHACLIVDTRNALAAYKGDPKIFGL
jgi:UDP-N-acetyl-D-glucosamine dehydrogenase